MRTRLLSGAAGTLVCALGLVTAASAEKGDPRPGRYAGTLQITIMGEPQPSEEDEQCFTAADVERLDRWLAELMGDACSAMNRTESDGRITFDVSCEDDDVPMTTRGTLTTTPDSFVAVLETTDGNGVGVDSVITLTARRVGACADR